MKGDCKKMNELIIDGVKYTPELKDGDIKICVLQRGWALIGRFSKDDSDCLLKDAQVIRCWGTTKGLGQLAKEGPTSSTKLDPCNGDVQFDYLTVVLTIKVDQEVWAKKL
jgi:hypothetical protein